MAAAVVVVPALLVAVPLDHDHVAAVHPHHENCGSADFNSSKSSGRSGQ
jgi:hypothetical protein